MENLLSMSGPARALLVTDLDGTLLDAERRVPVRNLEAMARAQACGVAVAIVTGRRQSTVRQVYAQLEGLSYRVASSNGSVILAPDNHGPESIWALPWELVDAIAEARHFRAAPLLCITAPDPEQQAPEGLPDCFVLTPGERSWLTSWTPHDRATLRPTSEAPARARPLVHVALHFETREEAQELEASLAALAPDSCEMHVVKAPYGWGALLELVPRGGKGLALRYFAAALGVLPEATAGIGDELNDAALLDAAAHRFTVGGSVLAARRSDATEVAPAEEGAVASALETLIDRLGL